MKRGWQWHWHHEHGPPHGWRHEHGVPPGWRHEHGPPRGLRHYYAAHLHRRIFFWLVLVGIGTWMTRAFAPRGLFFMALSAFVLWLISGKIARRIARPLHELAKVSAEIGSGNLNARATDAVRGYDEVGRLARAVNDMADRIQRQLAGQRELLAGVSHELRTPLARLRVLLDIARDRGVDANVFAEWERELLEMDQLVGELLASARLDFQSVNPAPLDAIDVAVRALARAGESPHRLSAIAPTVPLQADPTLLARALANLIDNARKHGGGLTRLEVATQPQLVYFAVEDRGPGIPAEIAERVFEPFVRGGSDGVAARSDADSSLGLGLALVARIARAHGGRVYVTRLAPTGSRFVFELPAAAQPVAPGYAPAA